jgi:hypothetical protein
VEHESRITRVSRVVSAVTSQIFRCHGLERSSGRCENLGTHDILYWFLFVTAISGWFLFVFIPQRERLENLQGRNATLGAHVKAERKELKRAQRGIRDLERGEPDAWERAARGRLGWMEEGEIVDVVGWQQSRNLAMRRNRRRAQDANCTSAFDPSTLRRPQIPQLPIPSAAVRTAGLSLPLDPIPAKPPQTAQAQRTAVARKATSTKPAVRPSQTQVSSKGLQLDIR